MIEKNTKYIGLMTGGFGVFLFSAKAVLIKLAYAYQIDSISLLLLRMSFALPFYVAILLYNSKKSFVNQQSTVWISLIIFSFIGYYVASICDFVGLQYIKASLERLILFIYPTLVILYSKIFLKTPITRVQMAAIVLTYIGLFIAFYQELEINGNDVIFGSVLILFSAIFYAGYLVGSGWLIPKFGATVFTSYAMIIACCCVIAHYFLTGQYAIFEYPVQVYWIALMMAILCTVIPSYLISWSIAAIGAPNFSIIGSLGPISTILLAYLFLDERLTLLQGAGTILVITGIYIASSKK